jgi:hypothetical protein
MGLIQIEVNEIVQKMVDQNELFVSQKKFIIEEKLIENQIPVEEQQDSSSKRESEKEGEENAKETFKQLTKNTLNEEF